jgi:hypothetical protein
MLKLAMFIVAWCAVTSLTFMLYIVAYQSAFE